MMLSPDRFPVPLIHISETDSTNNYLQAICASQKTEDLTTVVTDFQTSGKGQRGNSWESDRNKNLLFSFVFFPTFLETRCQFLISQIVSLAIKEELDSYTPDISIKWPNDIYWKEKKICGILIENDWMGRYISQSIVGIGLNINQDFFYSSAPNPISLLQITGQAHKAFEIHRNIMLRIQSYYLMLRDYETEAIAYRYKKALFRKEGLHLYKDGQGVFSASICGVEPSGVLILKDTEGKQRRYLFKEVEYLVEKG